MMRRFARAVLFGMLSRSLYNINRTKLEYRIHRIFGTARLEIEIPDRFGRATVPREWFLIPCLSGLRIYPLHVEGPRAWAKAEIGGKATSTDALGKGGLAPSPVIAGQDDDRAESAESCRRIGSRCGPAHRESSALIYVRRNAGGVFGKQRAGQQCLGC
jgi:hypothetical protein